jgi:hypothetical protein
VTEQGPAGPVSPFDIARQMREAADRLMSAWTTAAGSVPGAAGDLPGTTGKQPALPALPATLSTEKVQGVLDELADRRAQTQALRDSLTAFDEQLGVLEAGLRPVLEWTKSWADLEKSISEFWRLSGSGGAS